MQQIAQEKLGKLQELSLESENKSWYNWGSRVIGLLMNVFDSSLLVALILQ